MWVVKLGGSLASTDALLDWLDVLAAPSRCGVVIVPGGGDFADQVRKAQRIWRFNDIAAHRMAVLAMRQYGLMLNALRPQITVTDGIDSLSARGQNLPATIWLPDPEPLERAEISESWDVTSDSIAAWLAGHLEVSHLGLIKSFALGPAEANVDDLAQTDIVDLAFPGFLRNASFQTWLFSAGNPKGFKPDDRPDPSSSTRVLARR